MWRFRRPPKAKGLVEPGRFGARGAKVKTIEPLARGRHDLSHEASAHTPLSERSQHVEVSHAPDPRATGVGIDIEPAHADEAAVDPGAEERFAGTVETVRAA